MNRFRLLIALLPLLAFSSSAFADWKTAQFWQMSMLKSVEYFNTHAWDEKSGSYASEIGRDGKRLSEKRHLIATGRMIYGLAHAAQGNPEYLQRARRTAEFLTTKMIAHDALGPYFLSTVDAKGKDLAHQTTLIVNEQAYGLCGLVALYQATGDHKVLETLREMYYAFVKRFHDLADKGFFDGYDLERQAPVRTKSFDSTVYVATSFLLEFAQADAINRNHANKLLTELADKVVAHFPDDKLGFIHEQFDASWNPSWSGWRKQGKNTISIVGHGFQAAWFLMRASDLTENGRTRYRQTAAKIIRQLLHHGVADATRGGFYNAFKREDATLMWGSDKHWWQQAEAILALTLADRLNLVSSQQAWKARSQAIDFYFKHFVDPTGGEFDVVDEQGHPTKDAVKGSMGKSTYHSVEFARYMLLYLFPGCSGNIVLQSKTTPGNVPEVD